jgi:hypothetical protein
MAFDLLAHPIIFTLPQRLMPVSAWIGHIPVAYLYVDLLRPRTIVELGTHTGVSYSAFCQAVQILNLQTRCSAVDTWAGDAHIGQTGPEVLAEFRKFHDGRFGGFSRLIQAQFDAAVGQFEEGSIDLLHIDGCHSYEAVRHDFDTWIGKMSERGVVLLHDSADRSEGLGVYRLVEELAGRFRTFEFLHASGLAAILTGAQVPVEFVEFVDAASAAPDGYRALFRRLGEFLHAVMIGHELTVFHYQQVQAANAVMERIGLPVDQNSTSLEVALKAPVKFGAFASKHVVAVLNMIQVK